MEKNEILETCLNWMVNGRVGLSSTTLCAALCDIPQNRGFGENNAFPNDPSDFKRCVQFLALFPKSVQYLALSKVAHLSPTWNKLVENWELLMDLYEHDKDKDKSPALYEAMHLLIDGKDENV